jgi:hypothetical protein
VFPVIVKLAILGEPAVTVPSETEFTFEVRSVVAVVMSMFGVQESEPVQYLGYTTTFAHVPDEQLTVTFMAKVCPMFMSGSEDGPVRVAFTYLAATVTALEAALFEVTAPPVFASVPLAVPLKATVPPLRPPLAV